MLDRDPNKRRALIDRLLKRDEFADYWAMKWSDLLRVKAEFPINLWPNAAQAYHRWIRTSIKDEHALRPIRPRTAHVQRQQFPRAAGQFLSRHAKQGAAGHRPNRRLDVHGNAGGEMARQTDWRAWPPFSPKSATNRPRSGRRRLCSSIWPRRPTTWPDRRRFPDGTPARLSPDRDPREVFADWLIDPKNPWFTQNIANRVWSWLLGRGIIQEPDDIRPDNPPSDPKLLALLEKELIAVPLRPQAPLPLDSELQDLPAFLVARDGQSRGRGPFRVLSVAPAGGGSSD